MLANNDYTVCPKTGNADSRLLYNKFLSLHVRFCNVFDGNHLPVAVKRGRSRVIQTAQAGS